MVDYPLSVFHDKEYTINSTEGEAIALFGSLDGVAPEDRPRVGFFIAIDNTVSFTVTNARPQEGRNFETEAEARILCKQTVLCWPSGQAFIMGYINRNNPDPALTPQLFIMWVEPASPMTNPNEPLQLMIFFFNSEDCFSGGKSDIDGILRTSAQDRGTGQDNGGGVANGPNNKP